MTKKVDWAAVEAEFREGRMTNREIGAKHKISHTAVQKRAIQGSWARDLGARIKKAAEDKLARAAVKRTSQVSVATERQVVEANSSLQANIVIAHREDIHTLRVTIATMAAELGAACNGDLQSALELILEERLDAAPNAKTRFIIERAYQAAMSLGSRSTAGKNLVLSLATLIEKERQAIGIDKNDTADRSLGEFLASLPEPEAA